jgi:hypothetical protein
MHLSQQHPTEPGLFLEQMRTEDIATVVARAFDGGQGENSELSRKLCEP